MAPGTRAPATGSLRRLDRGLSSVAYYPFFMVAYVVLQAYVNNLGTVPARDVLITLAVVLVITAAFFAAATMFYGDSRRAAVPVALGAIAVLGYGYVVDVIDDGFPGEALLLIGILIVVLVGIAARAATRLAPITGAMNVASTLLLVLALVPIVSFAAEIARTPSTAVEGVLPPVAAEAPDTSTATRHQRDIYYIVLDRYGSDQSLATRFGIDNSDFTDWLRAHGFQVIDDARANYSHSLPSIASTLSMSLLDPIVEALGPRSGDYAPIFEWVRRSRAAEMMQSVGYRYLHIGSWFPGTRHSEIADESFASAGRTSFPSAILSHSAAGPIAEALGITRTPAEVHAAAAQYQLAVLRAIAAEPGPVFVFAHVLLPHEPYVFRADGTFDPDNASYESQLAYTNDEVRGLIEALLARPESDRPVILLQADEGPYPERYAADIDSIDWTTATPDDALTKFGILSAMFLPGPEGTRALPTKMTPVNSLRLILSRYLGADLPLLADRSFASTEAYPYDLTEVTSLIP